MKKLTDICDIQYGYAFDSKCFTEDSSYPQLVRIRDVKKGYSETYYSGDYPEEYILSEDDLLVGMDGEFNIARWKCSGALLNQRVCRLTAKVGTNEEYLRFAMSKSLKEIEQRTAFVTVKHLSAKELNKLELDVPELSKQDKIADTLSRLERVIESRQEELEKLDDLIKARFVEMFGNPLNGTAKFPIHQVGEVSNLVDPQPSHRTPPVEENGVPYVSIKDCDYKTGKIDFKGARKVSRKVLEEHLNRYTLHEGDFVIGKIGTIGNPVFVPARDDYTLSANVVLVQPDSEVVSPFFLKYSFESDFVERQFVEAKNSTSQAAFGIQKVRTVEVMNPDLDVQRRFEKFVIQVDKSKVAVKKALEQAQLLFDSLMQEYFG
ncbi:MAG: restriction endonuclease subunit S [Bacteroides sp.]